MTGEVGLVGLLQRADWTQLTLSADVSDGSAVLVAPGNRYWYRTADYMTGCDGGRPWELSEDEDDGAGSVHWVSGPQAPLQRLICPAWLLESSRLQLRGRIRFCGREALDVVMTRRPSLAGGPTDSAELDGPVEVVVDAETGVLLRVADSGTVEESELIELVRVDFAPVIDASKFQPPPGSRIAESFGETLGPALRVGATAVGLAAGALGAWIRFSPFRRPQPAAADGADVERLIARDEPPPDRGSDRPSVSDELLGLLFAGGPAAFAATLHQWMDLGAMAASVPESARRSGLGGVGLLMDAVSEQPATGHTVSTIRFAGPGTYQIDHPYQQRRGPTTIACDGLRSWRVFPDKITAGQAERPPSDIGHLADPSWLLRCTLSGGSVVTVGNRAAYRITVTRRQGGPGSLLFPAGVAVIDAELGLVLRLTWYIGDKPVQRYELRDVTTTVREFGPRIPDGLPVTEVPPCSWT